MSKKVFLFTLLTLFLITSAAVAGQVRVKGYYKKDGSYVQPHYRTTPDNSQYNNWSTKGNSNPYTGNPGTKDPYKSGVYGSGSKNQKSGIYY